MGGCEVMVTLGTMIAAVIGGFVSFLLGEWHGRRKMKAQIDGRA